MRNGKPGVNSVIPCKAHYSTPGTPNLIFTKRKGDVVAKVH